MRAALSAAACAERYCGTSCRQAARKWSHWKSLARYRDTAAGKEKRNGQSRRYRERVRNRKQAEKDAVAEPARVITNNFFRCLLRPAWLLRRIPADVLNRMEVWLAHQGRTGLTKEDRLILLPRFQKLAQDAASVAALSQDVVGELEQR